MTDVCLDVMFGDKHLYPNGHPAQMFPFLALAWEGKQ